MCGRYAINQTGGDLAATYVVDWLGEPPTLPRYNIAPQTDAPVLRTRRDGTRVLQRFRWGLIPYWAKDPRIAAKLVNARVETAATSSAFRAALERRRCIVPSSGFYEWTGDRKNRLPHWLYPEDGILSMAGVWESWRPAPGEAPVLTFAILTTAANPDVERLHDRMPVIVPAEARETWLDPDSPPEAYTALLQPAPAGTLCSHPVSTAVNRADVDGPELLAEVADESPWLLF